VITKEVLEPLKETATEQLTADYACYFGEKEAQAILDLIKEHEEAKEKYAELMEGLQRKLPKHVDTTKYESGYEAGILCAMSMARSILKEKNK
jgi:hypothetical protein